MTKIIEKWNNMPIKIKYIVFFVVGFIVGAIATS
jgi:hypothetical protein